MWSKEYLNLICLSYQEHQSLEMKFKQIPIEKESEISEKKIIINNLKNQINIFKEEKTISYNN